MIPFKCQSCHQEMSVPDSMAGHFEACPACKALVAIPGPNDAPAPRGEKAPPPGVSLVPTTGKIGLLPPPTPRSGIGGLLEFVGVLIAAIGAAAVFLGTALLVFTGRDGSVQAFTSISSGLVSFPVGLALAALGTAVVELKRIRALLEQSGRSSGWWR